MKFIFDKEKQLVSIKTRKHFDKKGGHNHLILERFGNNYVSVGLTTKHKKGKNHPNVKMDCDPYGKGADSYMRRQGTVDIIDSYSKKERNAVITRRDYDKASNYGKKQKKNICEKKIKSNDVPNIFQRKHQP